MKGSEILFLAEEAPEGGFEAWALGHSIYTQADTMEELKQAVRDAVRCHFAEGDLPRVIRLHLVREEVLAP
ncbi:MAG: 2-oxoisovalerate dehydrogenase E1 subunit beta [Candidatus Bipolaricaulota bacterium]|nr:2-oxoisovalerate dehydrogenase [Candidatus Bipolaricaulota bacterium]